MVSLRRQQSGRADPSPPRQEAEILAVTERSHLAISRFSRGPVDRISFMALKWTAVFKQFEAQYGQESAFRIAVEYCLK